MRRLQLEKTRRDLATPGAVAHHVEPRTVDTPSLTILDDALVDTTRDRPRLIFTMPPQEGKSQRVSRFFATWLLAQDPHRRIAIVSYSDALARRWGRAIRNDIRATPDLGLKVRDDTAAANEWQLDGYDGGVITAGIEAGLTGRPVDVLIIDDPLKGQKEADSETYRELCKEFWRTTASTRLSETAIVVIVMTRWHEDDLAGWLAHEQGQRWRMINIPAQAEHDEDRAERGDCGCGGGKGKCLGADILGRDPGEYMISARGRTSGGWDIRKADAGSRGWSALYQGHPSPTEGGVIKRAWWRYYATPRAHRKDDGTMHAIGADQVIQSWDMAFKDTDGSDYVVGTVWARRGPKVWLLDMVRDRMDFPTTLAAVRQLTARWPQATLKLIEDKANGPAAIATLSQEIGGILPYSPKDSKRGRAYSVSPFIEAGDVALPDPSLLPDVGALVGECASFPNGAHDDMVDSTTQALMRLLLLGSGGSGFMRELEAERRTPPEGNADDAEGDDGPTPEPRGPSYWRT